MFLDMKDFVGQLRAATEALDRDTCGALCDALVAGLRNDSQTPEPKDVARILGELRRKRYFDLMETVSTVYLGKRGEHPRLAPVRLQLVQSLIDRGKLLEARDEVEALIETTSIDQRDGAEARGLLGRIDKQTYVNSRLHAGGASRRRLASAVAAYLPVYRQREATNWWQGINAVACVARGERDLIDPHTLLAQPFDWRDRVRPGLSGVRSHTRYRGPVRACRSPDRRGCAAQKARPSQFPGHLAGISHPGAFGRRSGGPRGLRFAPDGPADPLTAAATAEAMR